MQIVLLLAGVPGPRAYPFTEYLPTPDHRLLADEIRF